MKGEDVDFYWPVHAVPGTIGFELLDDLPHPRNYDFFVWKGVEPDMHPYGICFHDHAEKLSTGTIEFLVNHGVENVLLGGLAFDYCVKYTAIQLLNAGFRVIINLAATKAIHVDQAEELIEQLRGMGIFFVNSSEDIEIE